MQNNNFFWLSKIVLFIPRLNICESTLWDKEEIAIDWKNLLKIYPKTASQGRIVAAESAFSKQVKLLQVNQTFFDWQA